MSGNITDIIQSAKFLFLSAILLCGILLHGITLERLSEPPQIDGRGDDICWRQIPWCSDFSVMGDPAHPGEVKTRFKAGLDLYNLYFLIEAEEPEAARMKAVYPSEAIWKDECLEIFIATQPDSNSFFQIVVNPSNHVFKALMVDNNTGKGAFVRNPDWNIPLQSAVSKDNRCWMVEISIPLAGLNLTGTTGPNWRFNIARERYLSGKHEIYTFAPVKGHELTTPQVFTDAILADFNPQHLLFKIGSLSGKSVLRDGNRYGEIQADITNCTGAFAIIKTKVSIKIADRTYDSQTMSAPLKHNECRKTSFSVPLIQDGKAVVSMEVFRGAGDRCQPLRYLTREIDMIYNPLKIEVVQPHYRNNIYATQPLTSIIIAINADSGVQAGPITVTMSGNGVNCKRILDLSESNQVEFDVRDLKEGEYLITAVTGDKKLTTSATIRKLPFQQEEVWLTADGITMVNGHPILPFGWYDAPLNITDGTNVIVTYQGFFSIEAAVKYLDDAWKNHKKVIMYPYQEYQPDWQLKLLNPKTERQGELSEAQSRQISNFVNAVKKHPAILAWYLADEPENEQNNPDWYNNVYQLMRQLDPYHPCIMTNWGVPGITRYHESADILMPDCYPNYTRESVPFSPMGQAAVSVAEASKYHPAWLVPQAFCWEKADRPDLICRPPMLLELRNQIHQAFCRNAKGIVMFSYLYWSRPYYVLREAPKFIAAELRNISDELLQPSLPGQLTASVHPATAEIVIAFKQNDKDCCIIAANTSPDTVTVDFMIKDRSIKKLYQQSTDRTINVSEGQFSDIFSPAESKVYLSSQKKAVATDLKQIQTLLAEKERKRYKTGNMAAVGEKELSEYRLLQHPELKKLPVITASSTQQNYHIRQAQANPLYFLLDGITDSDEWMNWRPKSEDVAPWIRIKFNTRRNIGRVILYTGESGGSSAIAAATIKTRSPDGKWADHIGISDNKNNVINLPFSPVSTDEVEISIPKINRSAAAAGILSEIEIYEK